MLEIEAKYRVNGDYQWLEIKLLALGFDPIHTMHPESTTYYEREHVETHGTTVRVNFAVGEYLRIRQGHMGAYITHKAIVSGVPGLKTRQESETKIDNPQAMEHILQALGFAAVAGYKIRRALWEKGCCSVVIDRTKKGNFCEIEGSVEAVQNIAKRLGFTENDLIKESYRELLAESL